MFKDLKMGNTLFVLDKNDLSYCEGVVTAVGMPRYENKYLGQPNMMIDVTVEHDGQTNTYVFPSTGNKAYAGTVLFAIDKQDVIADVKSHQRSCEQAIKDVEKHQSSIQKCKELLASLDTETQERLQMEERLDSIESMLTKLLNKEKE